MKRYDFSQIAQAEHYKTLKTKEEREAYIAKCTDTVQIVEDEGNMGSTQVKIIDVILEQNLTDVEEEEEKKKKASTYQKRAMTQQNADIEEPKKSGIGTVLAIVGVLGLGYYLYKKKTANKGGLAVEHVQAGIQTETPHGEAEQVSQAGIIEKVKF